MRWDGWMNGSVDQQAWPASETSDGCVVPGNHHNETVIKKI